MTSMVVAQEVERSADPPGASAAIDRITQAQPQAAARLLAEPGLRRALIAVTAASPWLTRVCTTDPAALDVLADLSVCVGPPAGEVTGRTLARWKALEVLRIGARDLLGLDSLEAVGANLSRLADAIIAAACAVTAGPGGLAVIG
ncbi:MAG: hypothetical protein J2P57_05160, partial [Acidimicrobiaceae bacterium]|nr:hypothetical protein [Acidimicrobiaceae bacterium]